MDLIYFDNAATTFPKPRSVIDSISECMTERCGNPGRGSHPLANSAAETVFECRETLSKIFGAGDESFVVFTYNATYALNIALKSHIPSGSHILISDMEHNAVLRPVEEMRNRGILEYDVFSTAGRSTDVIRRMRELVRPNTAAVVCTLASNICTKNIPVTAIGRFCREREILFIADGSQAAGHRQIDMRSEGIDILCIPGHKGLYGPQGIGAILYAAPMIGSTVIEGGSGSDSAVPFMPEYLPDRYEAGTVNTPGIAGLLAGVRFVDSVRETAIATHEKELWCRLYGKLCGDRRFVLYGDLVPSSVMLLNKKGISAAELGTRLSEYGICTRSGLHCAPLAHRTVGTPEGGGVRISFGFFNTAAEVDILADALSRA